MPIRALQMKQWWCIPVIHLNLLWFPSCNAFCLTSFLARLIWTKTIQAWKDLSCSFTCTVLCTVATLALISFLSCTNCFHAPQYLENNWYLENNRYRTNTLWRDTIQLFTVFGIGIVFRRDVAQYWDTSNMKHQLYLFGINKSTQIYSI